MPIERMFFASTIDRKDGSGKYISPSPYVGADRDIHILRGKGPSRALLQRDSLMFETTASMGGETISADKYLHDNNNIDVAIEFRPVFRAGIESIDNRREYYGFGIGVDTRTGEVRWYQPLPKAAAEPEFNNFLIEAVLTKKDGGPASKDVVSKDVVPAVVRVHIHTSIVNFWLTPSPMTVRRLTGSGKEQTEFRFTARAEFDDTVGDLTLHHGINWSPSDYYAPKVDSLASALELAAANGRICLPANVVVGEAPITITAALPPAWGGVTATAEFTVAPPWANDPALPKVEHFSVATETWLGQSAAHPENLLNILFVPTGYATTNEDDLASFRLHTVQIIEQLRTDPLSKPFDILADSINFWRVSLPSKRRGACVLAEVFTTVSDTGDLMAELIPAARNPRESKTLDRSHLLYLAGLPMRGDDSASVSVNALRNRWKQTWPNGSGLATDDPWPTGRDIDPNDINKLPDDAIKKWKRFSRRTFVDEIDSDLPTVVGRAPSAPIVRNELLGFHPDRGGATLFDSFLVALESSNGLTLDVPAANTKFGQLWAPPPESYRFDNHGVVTLIFGFAGGRENAPGPIFIRQRLDNRWPVLPVAMRRTVELSNEAISKSVSDDVTRTFVHELGHPLGLGDEYPDDATTFSGLETAFEDFANLTGKAAITVNARIQADHIKWNWIRIGKAAVLSEELVPDPHTAGAYKAAVYPDLANQFTSNDKVLLRARDWGAILGTEDPGPAFSATPVDANTLRLAPTAALPTDFNPADYKEGSMVYMPVPAPNSAGYPYAKMISPKIEKQIETLNAPLTRFPGDAERLFEEWREQKGLQLPLNIELGSFLPTWSHRLDARIVGLYEGGDFYAAGVYHPSGMCKMRRATSEFFTFCPVCRYQLVNFIDPTKHGVIDAEYARQYPA